MSNNSTKLTVVGVDIAKNVFQLHWVSPESNKIQRLKLTRSKFLLHFSNQGSCLVAMEACSGAHHWARELTKLGHQVKLLATRVVKPFVTGNKNDAADAQAIWTAVQQPGIKTVAVKSEQQPVILALHRVRQQLLKIRTMQSNALRGLLAEYGEVMPVGMAKLRQEINQVLTTLADRLPALVIDTLREQWGRVEELDNQIMEIEQRLGIYFKETKACQTLADIPGVGLLTATAAVATMGSAKHFKSGREFAAWLGLVPRQTGSGGKIKLLGISKRGDTYLRTLLIHGARSILVNCKNPLGWLQRLSQRKTHNVVVVALANKIARIIWALLAYGRVYQVGHVSTSPCC